MRKASLILTYLLLSIAVYSQKTIKPVNEYAAIDAKALSIPSSSAQTTKDIANYFNTNFINPSDKIRAAFIWVASNIEYDIDNMFALNFYEKKEEKIAKALNTHKGICENYAALFTDICSKIGFTSYVVEGYTKQNGFTDYIPHAWCGVQINGNWLFYDPTWGSGYVNNRKFYKKINNYYFSTPPSSLIRSHMPFDYLWQCLYYPVTNKEFYDGNVSENKSKLYFSYPDSIAAYERLSHTEQMADEARRIEKNGLNNSMIFDRLQHIKLELENTRQNEAVNNYNGAVADYNDAIHSLNDFIQYRNNRFSPEKPDSEIQSMLDDATGKLNDSKTKLKNIRQPESNIANMIVQMTKNISDVDGQLAEQQDWLKKYFSKGKAGRKSMFYKVTWFGIPLN